MSRKIDNLGIYVVYNSTYFEDKGYRSDVYIEKNGNWYQINVFDLQTLYDEAEGCFKEKLGYNIVPNLMIVKEITDEEIIRNALVLNQFDYFEQILSSLVVNEKIIPTLRFNSITKEEYYNISIKNLTKIN